MLERMAGYPQIPYRRRYRDRNDVYNPYAGGMGGMFGGYNNYGAYPYGYTTPGLFGFLGATTQPGLFGFLTTQPPFFGLG